MTLVWWGPCLFLQSSIICVAMGSLINQISCIIQWMFIIQINLKRQTTNMIPKLHAQAPCIRTLFSGFMELHLPLHWPHRFFIELSILTLMYPYLIQIIHLQSANLVHYYYCYTPRIYHTSSSSSTPINASLCMKINHKHTHFFLNLIN